MVNSSKIRMSFEMQRLVLKEILEELDDYDRVLNREYSELNKECCSKLSQIHAILFDMNF